MVSHMELRVGLKSNQKLFNKRQPWKLQVCGAGVAMRSLLADEDGRKHVSHMIQDDRLEDLGESRWWRRCQSLTCWTDPKTQYREPHRHLSLMQFLTDFSKSLPRLMADIRLDYITLTRICNALMVAVRVTLYRQLGLKYPFSRAGDESNDNGLVYMVLEVLKDNKKAAAAVERTNRCKEGGGFEGGDQLNVAGRAMEAFLNGRHCDQVRPCAMRT